MGGRVRGAGAVSPRGAEPGRSEALSPAEGPLCRRRDPRFLHISGLRGIGTVSGARDRPALSSPPPGFSGRTRLPGSSGGQGPGAPVGTGPQIPPGPGPSMRVACLAGAASRSGRPSSSPSWGDAAAGGAVGRGHGAAWASGSAGRPVCSPRAGGHQARRLRRLPAERRGGPKLRLGVNCTRAASLIHVSGVEEPRSPALGGRNILYKYFAEGVLSPAKISRLVI